MATQVAPAPAAAPSAPSAPLSFEQASATASAVAAEVNSGSTPATDGQPVQVAPPEQGQPASPAPETTVAPASNLEAPEYKSLLAKFNGDPAAAAKWAWENNNRNATLANKLKELGVDPTTLQPIQAAPPVPQVDPLAQPEPVVQIDARQVDEYVQNYLGRDTDAQKIVNTYNGNLSKVSANVNALNQIQTEIQKAQLLLTLPQVAGDSFKKDEIERQLLSFQLQEMRLDREAQKLQSEQQSLNSNFVKIANEYRDGIRTHLTKQETAKLEEARYTQAVSYHEQQFAQAWTPALDQAITAHSIPADLAEDFKAEARTYALAEPTAIADVNAYVQSVAKHYMDKMDKFHRAKAGQYGAQAAARAATPGPNGAAAVAPPNSPPVPESLNDLAANARARLRANWQAIGA